MRGLLIGAWHQLIACQRFFADLALPFVAPALALAFFAGPAFLAVPRRVAVVALFAIPDSRGADLRGPVFVLAAVFAGRFEFDCADRLAGFAAFAVAGLAAFARAGSFSIAAGVSAV